MNKWEAVIANSYMRHGNLWLYSTRILSMAATLGWMAFTLVFLGTPDLPTSKISPWWVPPPTPEISPWWVPVGGHLFLFGVLGVLTAACVATIARSPVIKNYLIAVALMGILWGTFTELYQLTVPGRSASVEDLGLDLGGSVCGGIAAWALGVWIIRRLHRWRNA